MMRSARDALVALSMQVHFEKLENVGRESHTYLHHIVEHYDELAPWTIFTQASKASFGYRVSPAQT